MNRIYKLFKEAAETKNEELWTMYKKLRNEITSDVRKAKASYFQEKLNEVKTGEYWILLNKATEP